MAACFFGFGFGILVYLLLVCHCALFVGLCDLVCVFCVCFGLFALFVLLCFDLVILNCLCFALDFGCVFGWIT